MRHQLAPTDSESVNVTTPLQDLSDVHFPAADKIVVVQDNLSPHTPASRYTAFSSPKHRLANRFEWHTPCRSDHPAPPAAASPTSIPSRKKSRAGESHRTPR